LLRTVCTDIHTKLLRVILNNVDDTNNTKRLPGGCRRSINIMAQSQPYLSASVL